MMMVVVVVVVVVALDDLVSYGERDVRRDTY